ncbi:MAG: hypothetical protein ACK5JT_02950 [Hyphomicrobiaceae bacterium]
MDLEAEIEKLKRRVGDLEGAVNMLTGQMSQVHPELATIRDEANKHREQSDKLMQRIVHRLDTMNSQIWSLRDDLTSLIVQAISDDAKRSHRD